MFDNLNFAGTLKTHQQKQFSLDWAVFYISTVSYCDCNYDQRQRIRLAVQDLKHRNTKR